MWHLRKFGLACLLLPSLCDSAQAEDKAKTRAPPKSFTAPPDNRPAGCAAQTSDPAGRDFQDLKASIIIPYRNESWMHIKASLESILYYTPKKYLAEILFVSDGNVPEKAYIDKLRTAASKTVSVLVLPHPGVGLIEAKMRAAGAAATSASVLVFMEPHVRVNRQWLQPLLRRIREYPRVLAMPALDYIPPNNFDHYEGTHHGHWRFEWNFNIIYTSPGGMEPKDPAAPNPSPATSGGIYAIRRDWWNKLELFDTGMTGWGGDHVEASFKVWMCGGHVDRIPCSRVGHMFRGAQDRPYDVETSQVVKNYARMAKIWAGEKHLESFYKMKGDARDMDVGDISEQLELQERLQCKDMDWYLENVDREMQWEEDHICVPDCPKSQSPLCCDGSGIRGRTTLDKIMPESEYKALELWSPGPPATSAGKHAEL